MKALAAPVSISPTDTIAVSREHAADQPYAITLTPAEQLAYDLIRAAGRCHLPPASQLERAMPRLIKFGLVRRAHDGTYIAKEPPRGPQPGGSK